MRLPLLLFCFSWITTTTAQEVVAPLRFNPALSGAERRSAMQTSVAKTTVADFPFFEDFLDYSQFPSAARWSDAQVYINNTMGISPISRGVATFDALNERGRPYDTTSPAVLRYADSLTSDAFDLSDRIPGDSIYFSFFYQPQGRGFAPEFSDSFMLYFRAVNGQYRKQWSVAGSPSQPFRQVMIPVTDTSYFYNGFRFRFVNKASVNLNDDVWNLDYIRFGGGRNVGDTAINDPAMTSQPSPFLNDYVAMPYRQFIAASAGERAANLAYSARANRAATVSVPDGFQTTVTGGGIIGSGSGTLTMSGFAETVRQFPNNASIPGIGAPNARVVFQNRFFFGDPGSGNKTTNDTIVRETVFDNYLAYDDGTAERSYFLNLFPSLPGKVAIEHRLNVPDTLRGVSVLFGQQVPTATGKFFTAVVYRSIAGIGGATSDDVLYQQDFLQPGFTDTVNSALVYRFNQPVPMPAGRFYIGLTQPALSGSDSLYYALDVNRVGSNHLYFNVLNQWEGSLVSGALMVRPLLGAELPLSVTDTEEAEEPEFSLFPNPSSSGVRIEGRENSVSRYRVVDMQGRVVLAGSVAGGEVLPTEGLTPGVYFVQLSCKEGWSQPKRWVKL
jgi:hypothetical protein